MVTVIIPNYNHARFLDQRIQSVLNQTYKNIELIILDDFSQDGGASRAVIERYRSDPRVSHVIYNTENTGSPFIQWEKGIKLAKGELIWIAESDDSCSPLLLEKLISEFKKNDNLALAYSLSQLIDENGKRIGNSHGERPWVTRMNGNDYVVKYLTISNHCLNVSACLFKKSSYEIIEKKFLNYKASGDWLFWVEISQTGDVAIINKKLNYFRRHARTLTKQAMVKGVVIREFKETLDFIKQHFKISKIRVFLARQSAIAMIQRGPYLDKMTKDSLLRYWELPPQSLTGNHYFIRILILLQNRWNIYF